MLSGLVTAPFPKIVAYRVAFCIYRRLNEQLRASWLEWLDRTGGMYRVPRPPKVELNMADGPSNRFGASEALIRREMAKHAGLIRFGSYVPTRLK